MMKLVFKDGELEIPSVCPVCKTQGAVPHLSVDGVEQGKRHLEMAECKKCETLYFTSQDPVVGYGHQGFEENYWLNYVQSGAGLVGMLEPLLAAAQKKGGKLLDVGCGFGFIPHFWESCGYGAAVGLETSQYGHIGKEKLGVTIHHVYYADAKDIAGEKFDIVYSSEVLEHVPDPAAFIEEISVALADDGILILTTPCADAVKSDTPPQDTIAILSPGFHYFVTRENALRQLLQDQGFAHIHIQNSGSRLFAWASHKTLPRIENGFTRWDEYFRYLEVLSQNPDPHVAAGALYRLVKDAVNLGRFSVIKDSIDRWATLSWFAYGFDFLSPQEIKDRYMATTEPRHKEFPSWLGCGLLFYVRAVKEMGGEASLLFKPARSAVPIMERQAEQLAQFGQEPAHFLPLARETVAELERAAEANLASNIRPQFARAPQPEKGVVGRSIALLCGWSPDGYPSPALVSLCKAMAQDDVDVHVCLAVGPVVKSIDTTDLEQAVSIAFRPNDSYDFGVWSAQLAALPDVWNAERIIFV